MSEVRNLIFYPDASHGWLQVDRKDLKALDIADEISEYSYQLGSKVYLEEDCDVPCFMNEAKAAGWDVTVTSADSVDYSAIRSYPSYRQ